MRRYLIQNYSESLLLKDFGWFLAERAATLVLSGSAYAQANIGKRLEMYRLQHIMVYCSMFCFFIVKPLIIIAYGVKEA
jgi:hypothetical protein